MLNQLLESLRKLLSPALGWRVPLLGLSLALTMMAVCWPYIDGAVIYPEFVTGPHSWMAGGKARDVNLFYGFLAGTLVFYGILNGLFHYLRAVRRISPRHLRSSVDLVFLALAPWLGIVLTQPGGRPDYGWGMTVLAAALIMMALLFRRRKWMGADMGDWPAWLAGNLILGLFSGFALSQFLSFFMPDVVRQWHYAMHVLAFGPFFCVLAYICSVLLHTPAGGIARRVSVSLVSVQILLPLLVLAVLPSRLTYEGEPLPYEWPLLLAGLLLLYVLLAWRSLLQRWRRVTADAAPSPRDALSPFCLSAIAVFIGASTRRYPMLWTDEFHLGEQLLPWMQWIDFGKTPFVDYAPFHGFMHLVSGALNALFFDATAGHYWDTMAVLFALSAGLTYWTIHRVAGARAALLCAMLTLPQTFYMSRLLFVPPAFFLLATPWLLAHSLRWLIAWAGITSFLALYNTVAGASFGLATLPFAVWHVWLAWRTVPRHCALLFVCGCLLSAILLGIPVTREIAMGYAKFILENRFAYEVTRGIPWENSFGRTPFSIGLLSNTWVYELLRFSWVGVFFLALNVFLIEWGTKRRVSMQTAYLTLGTALLLYAFKIYALQRIDPGGPSRTGTLSYLMFASFVPVLLMRVFPTRKSVLLLGIAFCAGIMSVFMGFQDRLTVQGLFWKTYRTVDAPAYLVMAEGDQIGIPRLGRVLVERERLDRILAFREALSQVITPEQTYYDLTNHQSYYFYTGRPVPTRYAAHASAVNALQQVRVIQQLEEDPPPAIFIDPIIVVDQKANIRSYYLYRYALLNYRPVIISGFTFLVNASSPAYDLCLDKADGVRVLSDIYARYDLREIPSAWGRSWDRLRSGACLAAVLSPDEAHGNRWSLDVSGWTLSGADADLLVITLAESAKVGLRHIELTWRADDHTGDAPIRFSGSSDRFIVPLGAFPQWLLAQRLEAVCLTLNPPADVSAVELWHRTELRMRESEGRLPRTASGHYPLTE